LPGGDATIRRPYRAALSHLWAAGLDWTDDLPPVAAASAEERGVLARQLDRGFMCVPTSSMGRLFDAVSSLLGLRHTVSYEGQAAIELEIAASSLDASHPAPSGPVRYAFMVSSDEGPTTVIDPRPVVAGVVADLRSGTPAADIAAGFHEAVADLVARLGVRYAEQIGTDTVALTGGVFQNTLLLVLARRALASHGLAVLTHRLVPPNDGGLALGQVAIAGAARPRDEEA
jgi:hydrogenase maturation protein HypF